MGEPGSNGSDGITGVFVRKVVDLAFEKNLANLMRANAVDFKKCVGVVDFVEPELGPARFKLGVDGPPRENWQSRSLASHSQVPCLLAVSVAAWHSHSKVTG